jgi:hypothetical protein
LNGRKAELLQRVESNREVLLDFFRSAGAAGGDSSTTRAIAPASTAQAHLADYAGIFQADAFGGYNKLYEADRKPGPIVEAACWVHARRPFFVMADIVANARRKVQGKTSGVISPLALEAVRRIDALFEIERSINGQSAERRRTASRTTCPDQTDDRLPTIVPPRVPLTRTLPSFEGKPLI